MRARPSCNAKRSVNLGLLASDGDGIVPAGNVSIPPNQRIPEAGRVIEVRYLYAFRESGSVFQLPYLGERSDIPASDCTVDQLKYKSEPVAAERSPPVPEKFRQGHSEESPVARHASSAIGGTPAATPHQPMRVAAISSKRNLHASFFTASPI